MLEGIFGCQRAEINSLGLYIDVHETELITVWMFIVHFMVCSVGSVWCTGMSEWHSFPLSMDIPIISCMLYNASYGCCPVSNYGINYRKDKVMLSLTDECSDEPLCSIKCGEFLD